ncbi:adenylate/guanylate cyclase domain-containing protein [Pseudomonas sp. WS 5146]|uniref:adenylate/guanylate cyclase domain-containing protein n=1 Tax=Pseudomonas sp. WS 5146 TaxID=2717494 RepID=UPI0016AB22BA|nr:adenylate/guanylate cyclase domain-containing protein [Pseudomonas sp. WS 5146]NMX57921.1 adenylate/guanylate cyclase domain-containing protein [Pseudomonas sp. WS 5146]
MSRMNKIFGSFEMDPTLTKSARTFDSTQSPKMVTESVSLESVEQIHDYGIQNNIRKLYGKPGIKNAVIGGHPDFDHLVESGEWQKGFVTSLFVDIQGSTRLGVYYSPEMVFYFKNQIIKCAIECVLAFDGHVHRIMGDAVLAFFRGEGNTNNSAIDAINCGAVLVQYIREEVVPKLRERGLAEDVGIRVGIDYGTHEQVLWGMYGYAGVSEVTATSFHVDVAAKLQQSAPRNRVMLGQSVVDLLDLHDEVVEVRRATSAGEKITLPYVSPNYRDADGRPMNYRQYVLSQDKYSALLPYPEDDNYPIKITSTIKREKGIQSDEHYYKCSRSVPLHQGIEFKALFRPITSSNKIEVNFRVENNGKQAGIANDKGNHATLVKAIQRDNGLYFAKRWEGASYLGLHHMFVSVLEDGVLTYPEQKYSVFIG